MKKIFIMLALIAGTVGSFANTSELKSVDDFGICTVTVTFYDSQGNVTGTTEYVSTQFSEFDCQMFASRVGDMYE